MPRRGKPERHEVIPDAKYGSLVVAKFINRVMMRGQKATAERIVYNALGISGERLKKEPVEVLEQVIKNVTPLLEVRARRVGGATYQVPLEVPAARAFTLATKWLIRSTRSRSEKSTQEKLACEMVEAFQGRGASIKKREDTHRMAEANKAFAHYRW